MSMLYLRNKPIGAISSGASGGGHTIENTSGTDMEQRSDLQFVGVYTEDDSANDRTKVNVVRTMTKAQMDALSAAEKVGFIRTSDEADNPYESSRNVSVTADGTKNERVLLNELFALVDITELNPQKSFIKTLNVNGNYSVYRLNAVHLTYDSVGVAYFTMEQIASSRLNVYSIILTASVSSVQAVEGGTFHDYSTDVESAGYKFILYY